MGGQQTCPNFGKYGLCLFVAQHEQDKQRWGRLFLARHHGPAEACQVTLGGKKVVIPVDMVAALSKPLKTYCVINKRGQKGR